MDKKRLDLKRKLTSYVKQSSYFDSLKMLGHCAYKRLANVDKIDDILEKLVVKYETKHIKDYKEVKKVINYLAIHQISLPNGN